MTEEKLKELITINDKIREVDGKLEHLRSGLIEIKISRNRANYGDQVIVNIYKHGDELYSRIVNHMIKEYEAQRSELQKQFNEG